MRIAEMSPQDIAYWKGQVSEIARTLAMDMARDVAATNAARSALESAKAIVRICYDIPDLDDLYREEA